MHPASTRIVAVALTLFLAAFARAEDDPWTKQHPAVSWYPGSAAQGMVPSVREFDELTLVLGKVTGEDQAEKSQKVEGKVYYAFLSNPEGRSVAEVFKNYEQALAKGGFKTLFTCKDAQCGANATVGREVAFADPSYVRRYLAAKLSRAAGDLYVSVLSQAQTPSMAGNTTLHVVEVKPMEEGMVKVDAAALGNDLTRTGHATVYGIYFDSNKAVVKPESEPALAEIAKLLGADPKLKLFVVGHTDGVGALSANLELSKARAKAVVLALTSKHGVAAARLEGQGVGQLCPVEANDTEQGRAKNRRVELVRR